MKGWIRLGNSVVMKACVDYAHGLNELERLKGKRGKGAKEKLQKAMGEVRELEAFFLSRYAADICPDSDLIRMMGIVRANRKSVGAKWRMLSDSNWSRIQAEQKARKWEESHELHCV